MIIFQPSKVYQVTRSNLDVLPSNTVGLRQNWKPLVSDSENLKGSFVYWKLWAHSNSGTATKELLLIAAGYGN